MGVKHCILEDKRDKCSKNNIMHDDKQCLFSIDLTADETASNTSSSSAGSKQQDDDSSFSLITWNIDGLDLENLQERAKGVCSYLTL